MINKKDYKVIGPFKGWVLQNFPFIEADFDSITSYQLWCKVVEYLNKVIYNEALLEDQSDELVDAFNNLKTYVDNYFDNLDVQDEVNHKLDEMVEDGTFTNLINSIVHTDIDPIINQQNNRISIMEGKIENVVSGNPTPVDSTSDMTDPTKYYLLLTDGYIWYYDGTEFVQGWQYQTSLSTSDISVLNNQVNNFRYPKSDLTEYLIEGYTFGSSLTTGSTIDTFLDDLVTTQTGGGVTPIIPYRDPLGNIINEIEWEKLAVAESSGGAIVEYDADGVYIRKQSLTQLMTNGIGSNTYFFSYRYYSSIPVKPFIKNKEVEWLNRKDRIYTECLINTLNKRFNKTSGYGVSNSGQPLINKSNLYNYKDFYKSNENMKIYDPILIKDKNGKQLVNIEYNTLSSATIIIEYNLDGEYIGYKTGSTYNTDGFNENTHYVILQEYISANVYPTITLVDKEDIYYVGANRTHTSLMDLLKELSNDTSNKTIYIDSGEYDIFDEIGGGDFVNTIPSGANWRDVSVVVPANTKIIGLGKVILKFMPTTDQITTEASNLLSPINISGSAYLENLIIKVKNCRYCIHDETSGLSEFSGSIKHYKNLQCIHYLNDSGYGKHQTYACGFDDNMSFNFENCIFKSENNGTNFSFHNRAGSGKIDISNSCFISPDGVTNVIRFGNVATTEKITEVYINNSYISNSILVNKESSGSSAIQNFKLTLVKDTYTNLSYDMTNTLTPEVYGKNQ